MNNLSRGQICMVRLDPTEGREQAKTRPCLIISIDEFNYGPSQLIIVLPITSKDRNNPLHVKVSPPEAGLIKTSFILCDQIRTISHKRLVSAGFGKVSEETLEQVEYALATLLKTSF